METLGMYKAKRQDNGEWVEGNLIYFNRFEPSAYILTEKSYKMAEFPLQGAEKEVTLKLIKVLSNSIQCIKRT